MRFTRHFLWEFVLRNFVNTCECAGINRPPFRGSQEHFEEGRGIGR